MSEKLKLKDGTLFELIQMGISNDSANKTRTFIFTSSLTTDGVQALFTDSNLETVQHLASDGTTILDSYVDIITLKSIGYNIENSRFTVIVSVDAVEKMLANLGNQLTENKDRIDATFSAVDYILTEMI